MLAATVGFAGDPAGAGPSAGAAPSAQASSSELEASAERLRAAVEQAGAKLASLAAEYESASDRLAAATQRQLSAGGQAREQDTRANATRSRLEALARTAYKGNVSPTVTALLSGDPRALSDLARMQLAAGRTAVGGQSALADAPASRDRAEQAEAERRSPRTRTRPLGRRP